MKSLNYYSASFHIPEKLSLDSILLQVAKATEIHSESILAKCRKRDLVIARQMYCYVAKNHTTENLAAIGSYINKDHATVMHSVKEFRNMIDTNFSNTRSMLNQVLNKLNIK